MRPMEDMNPREEALLLMDQIKKVLLRRFSSPKAEIRFLDSLEEQAFLTPVALYSHWLRAKEGIIRDYEALEAKSSLQRALYLCFQNLGRWCKRLWKKRKGRKA